MPPKTARARSITPTTLKDDVLSVELQTSAIQDELHQVIDLISELQSDQVEHQKKVHDDIALLKTSTERVIDAGKFSKSETELVTLIANEFETKIDRMQKYKLELTEFLAFLNSNVLPDLSIREHYATKINEVTRFSINTYSLDTTMAIKLASISIPTVVGSIKTSSKTASSGGKGKDLAHMLHPLEVFHIREAIEFCLKESKKTALIDIFARKENGEILLESNGVPEIHTIVLYIQNTTSNKQILIIDPSNSDFSKHVMFNSDIIFMEHAKIMPIEILTPPNTLKIYVPPAKVLTGPNPDQPRDCVDIAVKIAFGLNKHQGLVDIRYLFSVTEIQEVTNQKEVNESLFFESTDSLARIRQASSDNTRKVVEHILRSMDKQIKATEERFEDIQKHLAIKQKNTLAFQESDESDQYETLVKKFLYAHKSTNSLYQEFVEQDSAKLGEICDELLKDNI